jgi:hypothetical protein
MICLRKKPKRGSLPKGLRILEAKVVLLSTRRPRLQSRKVALLIVLTTISERLRVR